MKLFAIALTAVSILGSAASTPASAEAKTAAIICPVTGEKIASPKDAYNSEVYKGKTYYFCCEGCKPMFDNDRQKYIKAMSVKSK